MTMNALFRRGETCWTAQIALDALTALLEGEKPLRRFHEQAQWYDIVMQALRS